MKKTEEMRKELRVKIAQGQGPQRRRLSKGRGTNCQMLSRSLEV